MGIRAAADGNFRDEYDHRLHQIVTLAGCLKNGPTDIQDLWMVYFAWYKPAIRYTLPVTTFTNTKWNNHTNYNLK